MTHAYAAPCRHRGVPSAQVVNQVLTLLSQSLAEDSAYLAANGLTPTEYMDALPTAVEHLRGSMAASNQSRRDFVGAVIKQLVDSGAIERFQVPKYGEHTIYRLFLKDGKQVGLIQKGCPDGAHSTVNWARPDWADELYLWWVCDSKKFEPGEHVWKGVGRVRSKVSKPGADQLDGVIFYSDQCGTADRPCPKIGRAISREGVQFPPPCIYVFPKWDHSQANLNWRGEEQRVFPAKLLQAFGIPEAEVAKFTSYVGFRLLGPTVTSTEITNRYGTAKATSARG